MAAASATRRRATARRSRRTSATASSRASAPARSTAVDAAHRTQRLPQTKQSRWMEGIMATRAPLKIMDLNPVASSGGDDPRLRGHGDARDHPRGSRGGAGGLRRLDRRPGRGGKPGAQGGLRLEGTNMTGTARRLAALRGRMRETGTDLVTLGPGSHMQWLVGFHPHADERPCLLVVGPEKEAFLMPALNAEESRGHTGIPFHAWADEDGADAALKAALADVGATGAKRVALDETMRADFALLLLGALWEP